VVVLVRFSQDSELRKEPGPMNKLKNFRRGAAAAIATAVFSGAAHAAGTGTGVETGFFELGTDLTTVLEGAGGFVILITSILIGGLVLAFTGRWNWVIASAGTALFLCYGVTTLTNFAGVTADVDMVVLEEPLVEEASS